MRTLIIAVAAIAAFGFVSYKSAKVSTPAVAAAHPTCRDSMSTSDAAELMHQSSDKGKTSSASELIYQSRDGGKSWQDISEGLPERFGMVGGFVQNGTIYMASEKEMYHGNAAMMVPAWKLNNMFIESAYGVFQLKSGAVVCNKNKVFFQEVSGLGVWGEVFPGLKGKLVNRFYESEKAIFAGCETGIYKSADGGKTWAQVSMKMSPRPELNWVRNMFEAQGTLVIQSGNGVHLSYDGGDHLVSDAPFWREQTGPEGYITFTGPIKDKLVTIANHATKNNDYTSTVFTSSDLGKTWVNAAGLFPFKSATEIIQAGETLACCHHEGVSVSRDQGKTWELVFTFTGDDRNFSLMFDNGVLYLVKSQGC
jgi:hypothetical protein